MNAGAIWLALAALGAGLLGGAGLGRLPLQLELAQLRQQHAQAAAAQATLALERLQAAQQHGEALSRTLAQATQQITTLQKEKSDAIKLATRGQPCLSGAVVRLLDGAPGLRLGTLPAAPGSAAAAPGAAARPAPDASASASDVALWAIDAAAGYEQCRARLDALIDWHRPSALTSEP